MFFSKRGEEKFLICRAAVKPVGRSPESKPVGAAWLDGLAIGKSVQCDPPFGKNNFNIFSFTSIIPQVRLNHQSLFSVQHNLTDLQSTISKTPLRY
ncbi:MAG: hypothetical protein IJT08_03880 [Alphaproteobacteria bacterium]|nr:hypothetical protein [Alphaproteobacteria bacterium]